MKKILLIEDDPLMLKILQSRLSDEQEAEFLTAIHPEEGLQKAQSELPDVILLDLVFPETAGLELMQTLKKNQKTKSIPVIVLTILGRDDIIEKAMRYGAADAIIKGDISLEELIGRVKMFLGNPLRGENPMTIAYVSKFKEGI